MEAENVNRKGKSYFSNRLIIMLFYTKENSSKYLTDPESLMITSFLEMRRGRKHS